MTPYGWHWMVIDTQTSEVIEEGFWRNLPGRSVPPCDAPLPHRGPQFVLRTIALVRA